MPERVTIAEVGARGDGIGALGADPVYVPKTLPGEVVLVERRGARGRLLAVEEPAPARVEPYCPYFAACGGCAAQHMDRAFYGAWKHGLVAAALGRVGLKATVAALVDAHGRGRRRLTLHARVRDGKARVGYMAPRSHDLVEVAFCPVAEPGLRDAPAAMRRLAEALARRGKPLDVQATLTEAGLDMDVRGHGRLGDAERRALIEAAAALDLARLSIHGEVLVERRPPMVAMGRAHVVPPPGGFLQATAAGEAALAALVTDACGGASRVADLFAGCGPFALRLAEAASVHAVEEDGAALRALERAARAAPRLRPVTTEGRDLFRRPLLGPELDRFEAVVLDPPRAGAEAQVKQIAGAKVPLVVSVSCDPGTFARDAAILVAGGFALERVTPVDQFKDTAHVEIVGVFRRPRR